MTAKIIDGRKIAEDIRHQISIELNALKSKYHTSPRITTIKVGSTPESDLYFRLRDKACSEVGIFSKHLELPDDVSENEILDSINKLNNDRSVHGIFIQLPLPDNISQEKLFNAMAPYKDVEGLSPNNMGKTLRGVEDIIPITPLSVLTILEHEKTDLKGKKVAIVSHSNLVGKPLAVLLLNRDATVSVCHVFTKDLKSNTSNADILITAAGVPKLIKNVHVKNNAFVIDVGIINTKDGICGDVDFNTVKEKAGKITPVPGGVGPVTVACSLINMVKTFKNCVEEK